MSTAQRWYIQNRRSGRREMERRIPQLTAAAAQHAEERIAATAGPDGPVDVAYSNPTSEGVIEEMSDSTVIQPGPGQTVVTAESGHRGHLADNMLPGRVWEMGRDFAFVNHGICDVKAEVLRSETATVAGFKDGQATAYQIEGRQALAIETARNLLNVQADKNYYQLSLEAVKNASAAELTARSLAAAAQKAADDCCCELKQLITAEAVATRGLIESNEKQALQAEITRLQIANSAFFTRNVPPTAPVITGA